MEVSDKEMQRLTWLLRGKAKKGGASGVLQSAIEFAGDADPAVAENIGWVFFYWLRDNIGKVDPADCKRLLGRYLKLVNKRPSVLHSSMLSMAVKTADQAPAFNMLNFFELWGPQNLLDEDYAEGTAADGRRFPSLARRVMDRIVRSGAPVTLSDIRRLFGADKTDDATLKHMFYDVIVRNLHRCLLQQLVDQTWQAIRVYMDHQRQDAPDEVDSSILRLGCKAADSSHLGYVPWFLESWNLAGARPADFEPKVNKEGVTQPSTVSLATGCMYQYAKKAVSAKKPVDMTAMIDQMATLALKMRNPAWTWYRRAKMMDWSGRRDEARASMIKLYGSMQKHSRYWLFLAELLDDTKLRCGCLAMAIAIKPDTDGVGMAHYKIGKAFHDAGDRKRAAAEFAQALRIFNKSRKQYGFVTRQIRAMAGDITPAPAHCDFDYYPAMRNNITAHLQAQNN